MRDACTRANRRDDALEPLSRLTTGRVQYDQCLHAVTATSPPYALCGAGLVMARVGIVFPVDDPQSCPDCVALFDADDPEAT